MLLCQVMIATCWNLDILLFSWPNFEDMLKYYKIQVYNLWLSRIHPQQCIHKGINAIKPPSPHTAYDGKDVIFIQVAKIDHPPTPRLRGWPRGRWRWVDSMTWSGPSPPHRGRWRWVDSVASSCPSPSPCGRWWWVDSMKTRWCILTRVSLWG